MSFIESCQYSFLICIRTLSSCPLVFWPWSLLLPLWNLEISRKLKTTFHDFKGFDINSDQEFTPVKFSPIALVSLDKVRIHMRKLYWQLSIKDMMYEHVEKYYIKERNRICHIFRKVIVIALLTKFDRSEFLIWIDIKTFKVMERCFQFTRYFKIPKG
jgi:hypothetical protein